MTDIVDSVQRVSDIIARISEAAAEQTRGIGQINGAVGGLEQMTQENAALVEQSAAAADMLKDQASRLDAVVRHFTLADATDPPRATNPASVDARATHEATLLDARATGVAAATSEWKLAKAS
jgi:hypothetical protein